MPSTPRPPQSPLRIACIQMEPEIGRKEANLEKSLGLIEQAATAGASLLVLPELCNTGYVFDSRAEAFALAEIIPEGESCRAWSALARRLDVNLVAGIAERDGPSLYNAAVLIGPGGTLGTYRKNHLWGEEKLFFEPGNVGVPVWPLPFGRVAIAICYDQWFPEVYRLAALHGADIVCMPTNWVPMPGQPEGQLAMANILAMAGAHSNGLFVAAADRVGTERGQPFLGRSLIVNPTGWIAAGPASAGAEEILYADVDLADARRARSLNAFNDIVRDRRADLYGNLLADRMVEPAKEKAPR